MAIEHVFGSRAKAEQLNGERALQCALYGSLNSLAPDGAMVLVEPTIAHWEPDNPSLWSAKPDLIVVSPPSSENERGTVEIGIELKFKPWGDVVFEDDLVKLAEYSKCSSMTFKYGIDLGKAVERHGTFAVDPVNTLWAFIAVGQEASVVASPAGMYKKRSVAEGILASCLVSAPSLSAGSTSAPYFWISELVDSPPVRRECR